MPSVSFHVQPALKANEPRRASVRADAVRERGPGRNLSRARERTATAMAPMRAVVGRTVSTASRPRDEETKATKMPRRGISLT